MAMLAERKRKIKWCLNPRGNDWANDENKFGQRMLEKMGWAPGTGLGARGQGRTDFVRIQIKNDTRGLGNKEKYDEAWTQQQLSFDNLLAELNSASADAINEDSTSILSLEEKSKNSRARVHYHKFTRGKDVSKYSSKDLNSIIGIGGKQSEDSVKQSHENTNSMYDYFKKKKKKINTYEEENYITHLSESSNPVEIPVVSFEESSGEKKKRKKKDKMKYLENEENFCDNHHVEPREPHAKKKKKKINENEGINRNETNFEESVNYFVEEKPLKKKKKKHSKDMENDQ